MAEITENTFTAYLGQEFQQKLMWQLLVEPEFAEKTIPKLSVDYFDDPNLKRLFIIMVEFFNEYEKVPNFQNLSINQAIHKYKTPNNAIEEEALFSIIKKIQLWNERILNKEMPHDGEIVQKATNDFVKQQEYRKLAEYILDKTKSGDIKSKYTLSYVEEKINSISSIGEDEDYGIEVGENIENALRKEFRQTIPTGVSVIDALTGGGLGRGEVGLILSPSGVGKTTLLTKIADTAFQEGKKVLQIVFEDTVEQIQRKHFTIWSEVPLSELDENNEYVKEIVRKKDKEIRSEGGKLIIKKFSQEDTTMKDIRNWTERYQKKWGYKFDIIVLDYLDCVDSHKFTKDRNEAELVIIKSFEAMAGDFNIPCWSAIQSNRTGFDAEFVEAHQSGGSIKRIQKAHFFMSVAKTPEQKEAHLANIRIIKARFAADGQTFRDCIFNNDTMKIVIEDSRYANAKVYQGLKKYGEKDIDKLEKIRHEIEEKSSDMPIHAAINDYSEKNIIDKVNNDAVNEELSERTKNAFSNVLKENKTFENTSREKMEENVSNIGIDNTEKRIKLPKPETIDENFEELEDLLDDPDDVDNQNNNILNVIKEKRKTQNVIEK
jgi:nucleoside-triphosphatase THEP1